MDNPSDADTDSESNNEQRSQTSTETASEVQRKKNIHPPPKGTQHKHKKGKKQHIRRIVAKVTAQLYNLNEKLKL